MTVVELALYAVLLAAAAVAVWRRPVVALYLFLVGLALHNAVMAALYSAGVRGSTLTAITAWKEILLAVALVERRSPTPCAGARCRSGPGPSTRSRSPSPGSPSSTRSCPSRRSTARRATRRSRSRLRHDVVPVGAYLLGRSLRLGLADLRRLGWTLLGTAGLVAGLGLADAYLVSISWWRGNGVIAYFHEHLGYDYHGTGRTLEPGGASYGLPENFIYNVGGDRPFLRRLVSTFLSPLGSSYLLRRRAARRGGGPAAARGRCSRSSPSTAAGLLWTFSRSALLAVAVGLVVLAALRRRPRELAAAVAVVAVAFGWAHLFPKIAPTGNVDEDRPRLPAPARRAEPVGHLERGGERERVVAARALAEPEGRLLDDGPPSAGLRARQRRPDRVAHRHAAEGGRVELHGARRRARACSARVLWTAWGLALLAGLVRAGREEPWAAGLAAAFAAILALAIQTDVIGDPWVAYCVWALAGSLAVVGGRASSPAPAAAA